MKTNLSSSLLDASNKIVSIGSFSNKALPKFQRNYSDFNNFLKLKTIEIEKIKLPEKRKIKELQNLNIASNFGSPANLLGGLLGGALDVAGFLGSMFPSRGKMGKPQSNLGVKAPKPSLRGTKLKFGGLRSIGIANALFAGLDFATGLQQGESIGKAAAGAGGSLAGSLLGGAIGQALIPIPGVGFVLGSMAGGFLGGWGADRLTEVATGGKGGVSSKLSERLKQQEQLQKSSVQESDLSKIISDFGDSVSKFEDFIYKSFASVLNAASSAAGSDEMMLDYGLDPDSVQDPEPLSGELQDVTAEGGKLPSMATRSSPYGMRWGRLHAGVDYAEPGGTPVSVIQPGVVTSAGWNDGGYGYMVMVSHPGGTTTLYGHLSKVLVQQGQQVEPGTVIGNVGSTGRSTGDHLHFEIRQGGKQIPLTFSDGDKYFRFGGNVKVKSKPGTSGGSGPNPFVLELHADPNASGQKTGLIPSMTSPDSPVSQALSSAFGNYGKNFRGGLGVPKRGGNILETDMSLGAEGNAKKIVEAMMKDPKRAYHIFAGHADVSTGETGASGEKSYNLRTAELVEKLAKEQGLNLTYHRSMNANQANDPNSNFSRIKAIMDASRRPGIGGPEADPKMLEMYQKGLIDQTSFYPTYNQPSSSTVIMPILMGNNQSGSNQGPVVIPVPSGKETIIIPGPSESDVVNSLMKKILLTNLSSA